MTSNYAPPPQTPSAAAGGAGSAAAAGPAPDTNSPHQQQGQQQPHPGQLGQQQPEQLPTSPHPSHQQHQSYPPFDNGPASSSPTSQSAAASAAATVAAAAVAAHHGLQALQAATAAPNPSPAPATPHYTPQPLITPHGDAHYSMTENGSPVVQQQSQHNSKVTRLRRACDMCSSRKVKCDEAGPPCRPCRDLNVECTFNREMKRRGPPNKHAEAAKAAKRPRLEPGFQPNIQPHLQPHMSPTPRNAAEALVSIAGHDGGGILDAEAIAPWPVLVLLVDDFFTYIHPLAPFPHEPTFRHSFHNREDRTSREFLALLASMIGCLVASFPRSARLHLKSQQSSNLFPRAITMIERCRTVALEARGPLFLNKEEVTVYDAATSYFLGLAAGYTMQWKLCRRFFAETLSFIREMGYHKPRDLGSSMFGVTYRGPAFDHVQDQLGKRIFWVMLLGIRSMSQLGTPHSEIILPPPTPGEPYPDFPVEVDDQHILPHQILGQPEGTVSLLTGFVQAIKIYLTMNPLVSVDISYGITTLGWYDQRSLIVDCLQAVKDVMHDLPPELRLDLESTASTASSTDVFEDAPGYHYHPPAFPAAQPPTDIRHVLGIQPMRRLLLQYEIQKANIYASQLATRSYYVERYLNLRDASREHSGGQTAAYPASNGPRANGATADDGKTAAAAAVQMAAEQSNDPVDAKMMVEREQIVKHLLTVVTSLPQRNMEPNGASLINKIRQVASTLLNDAPERKGPLAMKAEEYLARFVGILMRLERTGPANGGLGAGLAENHGAMTPQDEEEELRNWADLREHQLRFAAQGGFMTGH